MKPLYLYYLFGANMQIIIITQVISYLQVDPISRILYMHRIFKAFQKFFIDIP